MYKVIIVDDEMIVRHAVKTIIKWEDSRFEYAGSASSGVSAMELVRRANVDIVITDIKMAEMDGLKLIKGLMAEGFKGEVLVLSNYNDFDLVREALKFGAYDYMLKLTLKTETFMQTLEEMAAKLDAKKGYFEPHEPQIKAIGQSDRQLERLQHLLKKHVLEEESQLAINLLNQEERQAVALLQGLCCYTFALYMPEGEHFNSQATDYHEMVEKLGEGLFPSKHFLFVFSPHPNGFTLIIATPVVENRVDAEEIAQRIIKLAEMYYGLAISVIYGQPATSFKGLIEQISFNRAADELRFYTVYQEGCQSNDRPVATDTNEAFRTAEAKLRESLRGSGDQAVERWGESACLLIESAAKHRIPSRSLKRILAGGIWGLANMAALQIDAPWNEKLWLEKVEAASSDSSLKRIVHEILDEILGSLGKAPQLAALRQEIRQVLSYLDKHFADRVSISEIASYVGLSEPYLCQLFKAETGSSILTRLNEIRMNRAYEMLLSGNYLVKQVAIEVGIPDPFYFNRLFRKRFGCAPKNASKMLPQ